MTLDAKEVMIEAEKERDIAQTLGPSDAIERAWLDYVTALAAMSRVYLEAVTERATA